MSLMCRAREEAEEKRDIERKQAAESAKIALRAQLAEQVAERRAAEDKQKVIIARGEQALESMHQVMPIPKLFLLLASHICLHECRMTPLTYCSWVYRAIAIYSSLILLSK